MFKHLGIVNRTKIPLSFQNKIIKKLLQKDKYALFAEMGLGKTFMSILAIFLRKIYNSIYRVLIICPKTISSNWENEIKELRQELGLYLSIKIRNLTKIRRVSERERILNKLESCDLLIDILNFESIFKINKFPEYDMVIIDESSRIKNPEAKRTKTILEKLKNIKYKIILSGTPITKDVMDIYSQILFLDVKLPPFKEFKKLIKDQPEILENILKKISIRIKKEDIASIIKFPEKIYETIYFNLRGEQLELYNYYLLKNKINFLLGNKQTILKNIIDLQRITSGFHPKTLKPLKENAKFEKLMLLLNNLKEKNLFPVVIWANYIVDIHYIYKVLKDLNYKVSFMYGATKFDERIEIIKKFNKGELDILVAHPVVAGIGINLQNGKCAIYYSNSFKLEDRLQSEDRIHRLSSKNDKVYYYDLVAKNTIDEIIIKNLKQKIDISKQTIDKLREEIIKYI